MLKRFSPPKDDHLFLSDSETESDEDLEDYVHDKYLRRKGNNNNREKSIKKDCKISNKKELITLVNGESSQEREAFKEEPENEVIKEAKYYQEYMKQLPVPVSVKSSSEICFNRWENLAESMKKKYDQPLHYLTHNVLKQWDQSRAISSGNINNNNEMMILNKKPIGNVIHPSKAEATVWVIEEFNRQFASYHYLARLWLSDPNYHDFL